MRNVRASDIYPNFEGDSTIDRSIPDPTEQENIAQVHAGDVLPLSTKKDKKNIFIWLGVLVVVMSVMSGRVKI